MLRCVTFLSSVVKRDVRSWQQSSQLMGVQMDSRRSIIACGLSEYAGSGCFQFRRLVVLKGW